MDRYDVVVVGAGSAGCVLAARLTEDPQVSVLLLEAGPPDDPVEVRLPSAFYQLFRTERDSDPTTSPQPALGGRELAWPRGRMLGGSSSLNAMIYLRGAAGPYQVSQRGGRRWSAADGYLRPALRRPNLTVLTDARVVRVLVARDRATGVAYTRAGQHRAAATPASPDDRKARLP